jgi:hypothetical protein
MLLGQRYAAYAARVEADLLAFHQVSAADVVIVALAECRPARRVALRPARRKP